MFGKKKAAASDASKAFTDYLKNLQQEHGPLAHEVASLEADLPIRQRERDETCRALDAHHEEHRKAHGWGASLGPKARQERESLVAARQRAYDALNACKGALDLKRIRLKLVESALGAESACTAATEAYEAAITGATSAERKVRVAEENIAAIRSEKDGRQARRDSVLNQNRDALDAHTKAALAARDAGQPVPDAPAPIKCDPRDETDRDLDLQLQAATKLRDDYIAELEQHRESLQDLRRDLLQSRFARAEARWTGALQSIVPELVEFAAARRAYTRQWHVDLALPHCDEKAIEARARELESEIPTLTPQAKALEVVQAAGEADGEASQAQAA